MKDEFAIPAKAENVVVGPGAKILEQFFCEAFLNPGDGVLVFSLHFPTFLPNIERRQARAVLAPLRQENEFRPDVAQIEKFLKTDQAPKAIFLNSPHNPTGGILTKKDILEIAEAIGDRNILVLSDEIYSRLIYDAEHFSIMSVPGFKDRTILLDGFSKTYAMTGWRLGYGVMRPDLASQIAKLATNSNSCTASFTQIAGVEALRGDQSSVDKMSAEFRRRRDVFVTGLNKIKGFSCLMPKGAFYAFPNITKTGWTSKKLADALHSDCSPSEELFH